MPPRPWAHMGLGTCRTQCHGGLFHPFPSLRPTCRSAALTESWSKGIWE